jgi:hypothetical protein
MCKNVTSLPFPRDVWSVHCELIQINRVAGISGADD